ncbi:F-box/LRR-repeat protein At5g02910-like [Salvia miltiorrhiza]|uniref:F-box/LRR-repeat protein At5g02910-like n=1 Tax=Salvia miltiorrhiza TaxID=226208 RepID=UPI0025ABD434|nr:F-box/LRR-repeat protein At5g02910-like [Salvia miltiorrhiza]
MAHLPGDIIQCIQSLLTPKEAARTSLVSKSWYGAWATTPNLRFFEYESRKWFPQFTKKTLQRYEDLNLKIQSFGLFMYQKHSLARELILKAIELGAADLRIYVAEDNHAPFVLPDEVLASQTLTRLSASRCRIDLGRRKKEVIPCSALKSLNLSCATVNDDFFKDLSWRFPRIEELTLKEPKRLLRRELVFDVAAMVKLHKLKSLRLDWLGVRDCLSKHDLWPQFPCLKELVLKLIQNFEYSDIRICSPSLERIVIDLSCAYGKVNAEFDVPNIRYLKLRCAGFPSLKFETTMMSREWVSDLEIYFREDCNFYMLKQFVKEVSSVSRVSLHLRMRGYNWEEGYVEDDGLGVGEVENLALPGIRLTSAFLGDLLRSCRPNFIYLRSWDVDLEVLQLQQLRRLPWKTNTFSSVDPWYYCDFAIRDWETLSDTTYDRFQLR